MPSYEKNKASGLWSCRFRETKEDGTTHQKRLSGYKTKRDAQFGYEDYIKQADELRKQRQIEAQATAPDPNQISFDELLESYLAFTKNRTKESSYYSTLSNVNNRLRPYFTGKKIKEITPKMISDWIEKLDYSYNSKATIITFLSSLYKYGEKYFDITNIMSKVDRPRNLEPKKELQIWTPEEFQAFIQCVEEPDYSLFFQMLYYTGCRRGEGSALTWEDFDAKSQTVRINKSITTKISTAPYKITTPKNTSSIRTVSIPRFLANSLEKYQANQKNQFSEPETKTSFIFGGSHPLPPSSADRKFSAAIVKANVKKIRIHDLRHSCASLLISKGISIVAVSRRLGHNNVEQTLNTYSHLMPDDQTKILDILENLGTKKGTK